MYDFLKRRRLGLSHRAAPCHIGRGDGNMVQSVQRVRSCACGYYEAHMHKSLTRWGSRESSVSAASQAQENDRS